MMSSLQDDESRKRKDFENFLQGYNKVLSNIKNLNNYEVLSHIKNLVDQSSNYLSSFENCKDSVKLAYNTSLILKKLITSKDIVNLLAYEYLSNFLELIIDSSIKVWVKKIYLHLFKTFLRKASTDVLQKFASNVSTYERSKLLDELGSSVDYEFQFLIIQFMFLIFDWDLLFQEAVDYFPNNNVLCQKFFNIEENNFIQTTRSFLDEVNSNSENIFSVFLQDIYLENNPCKKLKEYDGFWVNFNMKDNVITWLCGENEDKLGEEVDVWISVILSKNTRYQIKKGKDPWELIFTIRDEMICSSEQIQKQLESIVELRFRDSNEDVLLKLQNEILPKMQGIVNINDNFADIGNILVDSEKFFNLSPSDQGSSIFNHSLNTTILSSLPLKRGESSNNIPTYDPIFDSKLNSESPKLLQKCEEITSNQKEEYLNKKISIYSKDLKQISSSSIKMGKVNPQSKNIKSLRKKSHNEKNSSETHSPHNNIYKKIKQSTDKKRDLKTMYHIYKETSSESYKTAETLKNSQEQELLQKASEQYEINLQKSDTEKFQEDKTVKNSNNPKPNKAKTELVQSDSFENETNSHPKFILKNLVVNLTRLKLDDLEINQDEIIEEFVENEDISPKDPKRDKSRLLRNKSTQKEKGKVANNEIEEQKHIEVIVHVKNTDNNIIETINPISQNRFKTIGRTKSKRGPIDNINEIKIAEEKSPRILSKSKILDLDNISTTGQDFVDEKNNFFDSMVKDYKSKTASLQISTTSKDSKSTITEWKLKNKQIDSNWYEKWRDDPQYMSTNLNSKDSKKDKIQSKKIKKSSQIDGIKERPGKKKTKIKKVFSDKNEKNVKKLSKKKRKFDDEDLVVRDGAENSSILQEISGIFLNENSKNSQLSESPFPNLDIEVVGNNKEAIGQNEFSFNSEIFNLKDLEDEGIAQSQRNAQLQNKINIISDVCVPPPTVNISNDFNLEEIFVPSSPKRPRVSMEKDVINVVDEKIKSTQTKNLMEHTLKKIGTPEGFYKDRMFLIEDKNKLLEAFMFKCKDAFRFALEYFTSEKGCIKYQKIEDLLAVMER